MSLSSLTIAEAHTKLRAKEVSAVDLTQACIDRIEAVDSKLNVVIQKNFEGALEQAKKIDAAGAFDSALTGIPYLNKDIFCEAGVPSTAGSNVLRGKDGGKDYVPPFDSTTTAKLRAAGAISIGHSNIDEFVMGSSTESSCYGPARNPWNTACVPGGSSGGSSAGVAADECVFATGTDTGGSIRQPASLSGVTGLKVTYGRVSRFGVMAMTSSLDTIGPITKTVEDAALVLEAIAGHDPLDATTPDVPVEAYSKLLEGSLKGMKIGMPTQYFIDGMDAEVEKAVCEAAKVYESLGATVHEVSLPHTEYGVATYYVLCPCEVSSNLARYEGVRYGHSVSKPDSLIDYYERVRSGGFGPEAKRRIMIGTYALSAGYYDAYYMQALKVRTLVKREFEQVFGEMDLLLTPTAPSPAFKIGEKSNDPVQMYLNDAFTIPASLAGVPALSVPCGFSKGGLPIGMQLIGPAFAEAKVLMAGHQYQKITKWHLEKPKI